MRPRLSKTNRADSPNGGFSLSIPESRKRTLTDCDGISLRKEVRDLDHLNAARLQLLNLTNPPCLTPLKTAPGLEIEIAEEAVRQLAELEVNWHNPV